MKQITFFIFLFASAISQAHSQTPPSIPCNIIVMTQGPREMGVRTSTSEMEVSSNDEKTSWRFTFQAPLSEQSANGFNVGFTNRDEAVVGLTYSSSVAYVKPDDGSDPIRAWFIDYGLYVKGVGTVTSKLRVEPYMNTEWTEISVDESNDVDRIFFFCGREY